MFDKIADLTDNWTMARTERSKRREGARKSAEIGALVPSDPPNCAKEGATKRPVAPQRARGLRHHPKLKNYLLHYAKGKYTLINLSLKKKGHDQS